MITDPIDRELLYFLCAAKHHHCRVVRIKAPRLASLRRLREQKYVAADSYEPSASVLKRWRHVFIELPPSPGGAAGEEQPTPKAAEKAGGAAARSMPAAPPKPEPAFFLQFFRSDWETLSQPAKRWGGGSAHKLRKFAQALRDEGLLEFRQRAPQCLWRLAQQNTQGASGTARKAPSARVSARAKSATGSAPPPFAPDEPAYYAEADRRERAGAGSDGVALRLHRRATGQLHRVRPSVGLQRPAGARRSDAGEC